MNKQKIDSYPEIGRYRGAG